MTKTEAAKILAVLKVAYPNYYKNITPEEAQGAIGLWARQFKDIPYELINIAVNKLIAINIFPPSIAEVRNKLSEMYHEAIGLLLTNDYSEARRKQLTWIAESCKRVKEEPSLNILTGGLKQIETHGKSEGEMPSLQTRGLPADIL